MLPPDVLVSVKSAVKRLVVYVNEPVGPLVPSVKLMEDIAKLIEEITILLANSNENL